MRKAKTQRLARRLRRGLQPAAVSRLNTVRRNIGATGKDGLPVRFELPDDLVKELKPWRKELTRKFISGEWGVELAGHEAAQAADCRSDAAPGQNLAGMNIGHGAAPRHQSPDRTHAIVFSAGAQGMSKFRSSSIRPRKPKKGDTP